MKKIILVATLLFAFFCCQSQNAINFTYDSGGNLIQRNVTVLVPTPNAKFINPFSEVEEKNDSLNMVLFSVYPNPAKEVLNISGDLPDGTSNADLFLYSSTGQLLKKHAYNGTAQIVDTRDLKAGLYYLEIRISKKNSSNYKIIITN